MHEEVKLIAGIKFIEVTRTAEEWKLEAEKFVSRVLGVSLDEALHLVRTGHFEGTPFVAELSQLMFLAGEDIYDE